MNLPVRIRVATAAVAGALLITSCGSTAGGGAQAGSGTAPAGTSIAFANITEASPLFHSIHKGLDDALAGKDSGITVKWYDNKNDASTMLQNVRLIGQQKPDAMVLYPTTANTQAVGNLIQQSGIPCVTVNMDTPHCHYLNIDDATLGKEAAAIMGKKAQERGWDASNTTILLGQNSAAGDDPNASVRNFYATIAPMLGMQPVAASDITPTTTKIGDNAIQFDSLSAMQPAFESVKNLVPAIPADRHVIVFSLNDDATLGALQALSSSPLGAEGNVLAGGQGGTDQAMTALREDPRWVAESYVFIQWWGVYAVAMAHAVANGVVPPERVTPLPQVVLTKETADTYVAPGTSVATELPPLVPGNQFLADSGLLQKIARVQGLG